MTFEWPDSEDHGWEILDMVEQLRALGIDRDTALARLRDLKAEIDRNNLGRMDSESTHRWADAVLLVLLDDPEISAAFDALHKWYS